MNNYYAESWEIYKHHSEGFDLDFDYYLNFCKGYTTLELFAGYGRLANPLHKAGVDIETVEMEPNFTKYIQLPLYKNHICNVLKFKSEHKFERIIAGYNSFCLLTEDVDIELFFTKLDSLLEESGKVSLSYYHQNAWEAEPDYKQSFNYKGHEVVYLPSCDLSEEQRNKGLWIDRYKSNEFDISFKYPTRLYEDEKSLIPYLKNTKLEVTDVIHGYNKKPPSLGWIEFVLQKKSTS